MWLASAKHTIDEKFSCKHIEKLEKTAATQSMKAHRSRKKKQPRWVTHDLNTIFEDVEPLIAENHSTRPISTISSNTMSTTGLNLSDDPAILKLCVPNSFNDDSSGNKAAFGHRATSELFENEYNTVDMGGTVVPAVINPQNQDLATQLNLVKDALAWKISALELARSEIQCLKDGHETVLKESSGGKAKILERLASLGSNRKLRQKNVSLAIEVRGRDEVITNNIEHIGHLEQLVKEWEKYGDWVEHERDILWESLLSLGRRADEKDRIQA